MLENLTFEQEQEIEFYKAKWRKIILSTSEIDKYAAAEAIDSAYTFVGYGKPNIVFCNSPYAALSTIIEQGLCRLEYGVEYYLIQKNWDRIKSQLSQEVIRLVSQKHEKLKYLVNQYKNLLINQIRRQLDSQANQQQQKTLIRSSIYIQPEVLVSYGSKSDFCISVLNCDYDSIILQLFQSLIQNCGWIISLEKLVRNGHNSINFEKMVIICERPIKLSLDGEYRLHTNDGKPAIQFNDGYSLYSYHGLIIN